MPRLPKRLIKLHGISKKAWSVFRAEQAVSKRKRNKPRTTTRKAGKSTASRSRKVGKSISQQAFKWLRIVSLVAPAASRAMAPVDNQTKLKNGLLDYTGFDVTNGSFEIGRLTRGWAPYLITNVVTHGIPKLIGIIRRL